MQMGELYVVHLAHQAVAILSELHALSGRGVLLITKHSDLANKEK